MTKILFVCHGNICRSPMAEFVLKDMVLQRGLAAEFEIASAATSREEIGSPVHPGTKQVLRAHGVPLEAHRARQLTRADYAAYDYIIGMDGYNRRNIERICGDDYAHKVFLLLEFADLDRDIADPWYTNKFEKTYQDIVYGCEALLIKLTLEEEHEQN